MVFISIKKEIIARSRAREIERSNGLMKMRLLLRNSGFLFSDLFVGRDGYMLPAYGLQLCEKYTFFVDRYYGILHKKIGEDARFDQIANEIEKDYRLHRLIGARLFGVVFGISICKIAGGSNKMIMNLYINDFINKSQLEDEHKEAIKDSIEYIIDHISNNLFIDETREIGALAQLLLNIKPQKGHYADPFLFTDSIATACLETYQSINVTTTDIETLLSIGAIAYPGYS